MPVEGLRRVTAAYMPCNGFGGSTGKSEPRTGPGYGEDEDLAGGKSEDMRYAD